jgi:hypothetical protein
MGISQAVISGDHRHRHHHSAYRAVVEAEGNPNNVQLRGGSSVESVESLKPKKHSNIDNLNHKITLHGHKLDVDQYKPPVKIPGLEAMIEKIHQVEDEEESEVKNEQEVIRKVEDEFLNSDLHKEALSMKLFEEANDESLVRN